MLLGATPISPSSVDCLPSACSPAATGEQGGFEQALAQAASSEGAAARVADRPVVAPPLMEVQRATTLANPPGERVLHTLSGMYHSHAVPSSGGGVPTAVTRLQPGPASQPVFQSDDVGGHAAVKPVGTDFDSMMVNLRDVYRDVIQVSLVSKGTSAVSSSLNKLLSAG
ncbi:nodulation protein NolB [Bradyrhizobium sp. CNPSo 4016]|nr:nodulation protein NolB [Bradyrhizobium glycinis]